MIDGDDEDKKSASEIPMSKAEADTADPSADNVVALVSPSQDREQLRQLEALLFAAAEPMDAASLSRRLGPDVDVAGLLEELGRLYESRGVNLVRRGRNWAFRTAPDLAYLLEEHTVDQRRLSRAAIETLAIVSYHQPVTRAEIEEIRGVSISKGTLDTLQEIGWIRMRGRRRAPGRPITYGTTTEFLDHFGLESVRDLPGLNELKGQGLLDSQLPPDFVVPDPQGLEGLDDDEEPLEDEGECDGECDAAADEFFEGDEDQDGVGETDAVEAIDDAPIPG